MTDFDEIVLKQNLLNLFLKRSYKNSLVNIILNFESSMIGILSYNSF